MTCSDDRFTPDSTVFKKPEPQAEKWDGISLEDLLRSLVRENKSAEIADLIKMLPERRQSFYREIWMDEKAKVREMRK